MRRLAAPLAYVLAAISIILSTVASALINVGALDTPVYAHAVAVVGGLAYVADNESGLRIINVSNPAAPVELGALDTIGAIGVDVVCGRVGEMAPPAAIVPTGLETRSRTIGCGRGV